MGQIKIKDNLSPAEAEIGAELGINDLFNSEFFQHYETMLLETLLLFIQPIKTKVDPHETKTFLFRGSRNFMTNYR